VVRGHPTSTRGWRSHYYGDKEPAISALLETDQPDVCFWTFLGFEEDIVELMGSELKIRAASEETSIDLARLNK
jgi:hypothetical protein